MITPKHTQGPFEIEWRFGRPGVISGGVMRSYVNGGGRDQIAMVFGVAEDNGGDGAMVANAHLWKAAPDMLAALQLFVYPYQEGSNMTETERQQAGLLAIERALGLRS